MGIVVPFDRIAKDATLANARNLQAGRVRGLGEAPILIDPRTGEAIGVIDPWPSDCCCHCADCRSAHPDET